MEKKIQFWWQKKQDEDIWHYHYKCHGVKKTFATIELFQDGGLIKCSMFGISKKSNLTEINELKLDLEMEVLAEMNELVGITQLAINAVKSSIKGRKEKDARYHV